MKKAVERRREELEALVTAAYQQDEAEEVALGSRRGDALPAALTRREERVATSEEALRRLEAEAKADADAERARRAEADGERRRTGQQRRGTVPTPMEETPDDKAQRRLTDPELQSMRRPNTGGDSCGNAPARVDGAWQIILACDVTDATHAKQPAEPLAPATLATLAPAGIEQRKDASGAVQVIPAPLDHGSDSAGAVKALED